MKYQWSQMARYNKVYTRLNEIFMCLSELPLSGISVVLFEDLLQLLPVKEKPVDKDLNLNPNKHKYLSSELWRMMKYAEMTEKMRLKNHGCLIFLTRFALQMKINLLKDT